jgi:hypothetical protein
VLDYNDKGCGRPKQEGICESRTFALKSPV